MTLALSSMFWPSSRMSWELRESFRKSQGRSSIVVLELGLPGGTKRYAFGPGVDDLSVGAYEGRAVELTAPLRTVADRSGAMQDVECHAVIADPDNALGAILEGKNARKTFGASVSAVQRLGAYDVPGKCWLEAFRGIVDTHELVGPRRWRFVLRPNDIALRYIKVPVPVIDAADWPNAPSENLAQYGPLLYGRHDSSGTTQKGAVPLVKVSTTDKQYLLCWGLIKSIDAVYSDGVKKTIVTDYSGGSVTTNSGRLATIVSFVADQGSKAITADVQGYETVGDGSGTLIENPIDVLIHFATNWIFNDYKSGAWMASSTAPLDIGLLAQTAGRFKTINATASKRLFGKRTRAQDVLNELAKSWGLRLFWTLGGTLAARTIPAQQRGVYTDAGAYFRSDDQPFPINALRPDWETVVDRIDLEALYGEADGKYFRSLQVRDPTMSREASDTLSLPWSAAYYY